ncbi:hypothetical protein LTR05_000079 [Lithohypha guttulata]|uniref:Major royal jelly protein n=1 Tax=Lithohypha guttulata TaxID=1690604 RepID=A0AAN7YDG1_9EURO|nr:hypothetical protein LTR05_000079 [Lithohypha guttulata]
MFSNYPPALDPMNQAYTVAELFANNTEQPYPNLAINTPPGGRINNSVYPPTGAGDANHFVGVQSVVIDPADRLWVLDTGRVATQNGTQLTAAYGGPKLVGIDLNTNSVFRTIVFSPTAAPADSYLNDIRFDLNPSLTSSGQGVAYITDSSSEGRNAIVVVDLGSGEAWRRLINIPAVQADEGFVPTVWGQPVYMNGTTGMPILNVNFGADGIALSVDGTTLFFKTTGGRYTYSVPTARLRDRSLNAELLARGSVGNLGETGLSDGLETDTNNMIYGGNIEDNSIMMFNPSTGIMSTFVRDPRFSWTDTLSVGFDGYIYFTENQLWLGSNFQGGVDRRQKPYVLFRARLPNGGTKVTQSAPRASNATMSI